MRDILNDLKNNILCKRTRNKMLSAYLSNEYFGFDNNIHASTCIKCQVSGKRYKAFKAELENELQKEKRKNRKFFKNHKEFRFK